jgi:hypothetical protein
LAKIAARNDRTFFDVLEADERATLPRLLSKLAGLHHIGAAPIE